MNLRDMFHAANNDITPSEQLISDTLLKMAATEAAPQKKRGYMRYVRVAAVAACCVVIAVAAVALRPEQPKLPVDAPPAQTTTITPQESDVSSDDEAVTTTATSADGTESSTGVTTGTEGNIETQTGTGVTETEPNTVESHITTLSTQLTGTTDSGIITTTLTSGTGQSTGITSATTTEDSPSSGIITSATMNTTTTYYTTTNHTTTTTPTTTVTTTTNTEEETIRTTTTTVYTTTTAQTTMTTTFWESESGTYTTTTTGVGEPTVPYSYVTIGAVLAPIYEMDYLDGPTETVPDSGDLTFAEAEDWYGIDFYTSLGGLSCNQSSVSSGECVLTYGNMSDYNDTSRAGISFAVSSNWYPPPSSVSFDLYEFVQIGDVEVALGIYNPNGTSGAQQLCATIYDPIAYTYVHLYAKGITIDAFSEILTEIIY